MTDRGVRLTTCSLFLIQFTFLVTGVFYARNSTTNNKQQIITHKGSNNAVFQRKPTKKKRRRQRPEKSSTRSIWQAYVLGADNRCLITCQTCWEKNLKQCECLNIPDKDSCKNNICNEPDDHIKSIKNQIAENSKKIVLMLNDGNGVCGMTSDGAGCKLKIAERKYNGDSHCKNDKGDTTCDDKKKYYSDFKKISSTSTRCSGTYVKENLILTSYHCLPKTAPPNDINGIQEKIKKTYFIFDYTGYAGVNVSDVLIPKANIYLGKVVLSMNEAQDWALIKVEAMDSTANHSPLGVSNIDDSLLCLGKEIYTIGFPEGLPMSVTLPAVVNKFNANSYIFESNLDIFDGNSGGPIFDIKNSKLIGIMKALNGKDYKTVKTNGKPNCYTENSCNPCKKGSACFYPRSVHAGAFKSSIP